MNDGSIIIIGAGMGGLSAGIFGRVNGYRTTIFEQHHLPGGQCTAWKRRGYTFDACIHHLFGCSEAALLYGLWREVGAMPRRLVPLQECVSVLSPDGTLFRDYYDLELLESHMNDLPLNTYQAFKKMCRKDEWERFEPRILARLDRTWWTEQLKIRMHRREYDEAVALLTEKGYPLTRWDGEEEVRIAKRLEKRYPEKILTYYLSGLGSLTSNAPRKEYARKARVMAKVRRMLVEVIGDESRWLTFAAKVKKDNIRRPAFQEEFGRVLPGWRELRLPGQGSIANEPGKKAQLKLIDGGLP